MNQYNIPKIIHHIAPSDKSKCHVFWYQCYESWKQNFPDYKFIVWNDKDDLSNIIKDHYPQYWNLFNSFPVDIMRIDFARLCILHKYGGIYADMDVFCYKNFEEYLTKDIYFLENLTHEYTNATWENSMMAAVSNHRLLEELMKYSKTCFIQFRSVFNKSENKWRNIENDRIVNNTTGSGMISEAVKHFSKFFDIGVFDCASFNNRPMSYDESFYTKHIHTSIWGNEFVDREIDRLLIVNGCAYATGNIDPTEHKSVQEQQYQIVMNTDFDFHKDYTGGTFLKDDNLEEIRSIVQKQLVL